MKWKQLKFSDEISQLIGGRHFHHSLGGELFTIHWGENFSSKLGEKFFKYVGGEVFKYVGGRSFSNTLGLLNAEGFSKHKHHIYQANTNTL